MLYVLIKYVLGRASTHNLKDIKEPASINQESNFWNKSSAKKYKYNKYKTSQNNKVLKEAKKGKHKHRTEFAYQSSVTRIYKMSRSKTNKEGSFLRIHK